jgi:predicted porin
LKSTVLGLKYALDASLFLKVVITQNKTAADKYNVNGFGIDYLLTPEITITSAIYVTKRSPKVGASGKTTELVNYIKYALSKRTAAYASFTYARAGSSDAIDRDLSLGLIGAKQTSGTRTGLGISHSF